METSLAPVRSGPLIARRVAAALAGALLAQRGHLLPWVPVCLAAGIGGWFALPVEPGRAAYAGLALGGLMAVLLARHLGEAFAPLAWALALAAAGAGLAGARAHGLAAPVLPGPYYGPVEGRVVAVDRARAGALRLTLDGVVLARRGPGATPSRVRLTLPGTWNGPGALLPLPEPGARVMTTAWLQPPPGPAEPGGYDFRRFAWFERLGGVGQARAPVLLAGPPEASGWQIGLARARRALSAHVQQAVGGREGAFAAALIAGDRADLPPEAVTALRASNLAHLLAISGLHMGLVAGFVFAAFRLGLAAIPPLALRLPARKIAAGAALPVAFGYLLLSGALVATERAFVMVTVMLVAVMLDRRAFSLNSVAVAAVVVLALRPESLLTPGFQMSFAATVALVAAFGRLSEWQAARGWRMPRWLRPGLTVFVASLVAGAATAPVAAAHFNVTAPYGLAANLAAVPLMGTLVMPAAVVALALTPLGIAAPAWTVMQGGIAWILAVAETVAGWEGAVRGVSAPPAAVLPLMALSALMVLLWQGWGRLAGLAGVAAAFLLWAQAERPLALVSGDGRLAGVLGGDGLRVLSRARGGGFAAQNWLENDGDRADQATAAVRGGALLRVAEVAGDPGAAALVAACAGADLVLAARATRPGVPLVLGGCVVLTGVALERTGAVALHRRGSALVLTGAEAAAGRRLWSGVQ